MPVTSKRSALPRTHATFIAATSSFRHPRRSAPAHTFCSSVSERSRITELDDSTTGTVVQPSASSTCLYLASFWPHAEMLASFSVPVDRWRTVTSMAYVFVSLSTSASCPAVWPVTGISPVAVTACEMPPVVTQIPKRRRTFVNACSTRS